MQDLTLFAGVFLVVWPVILLFFLPAGVFFDDDTDPLKWLVIASAFPALGVGLIAISL